MPVFVIDFCIDPQNLLLDYPPIAHILVAPSLLDHSTVPLLQMMVYDCSSNFKVIEQLYLHLCSGMYYLANLKIFLIDGSAIIIN